MADSNIYSRLKRLFSAGTVVRNVGGRKLRVIDSDQIQSFVNRKAVDRYNRVYSSQTGGYGSAQGRSEAAHAYQGARLQLFRDYDMMDNDPIIASVLDIYADESTVKNEFNEILTVRSKNQDVQEILHNLFYDILNIEFNLWPWTRNMCKYGDLFLYLNIHPEYGIVNVLPLSIYETTRIEGAEEGNPFSVKFEIDKDFLLLGKTKFENFEVAHFRLLSDINFLPYGKAMIEGGRRIWKQLQLMEDAMLVHRIMRAPDKRKITVDIGNIPPSEVDNYMRKIIDKMRKAPLIDERTGEYNLRFGMQNITEDIFLPTRGKDSATDIQNLEGLKFAAIEDIEYLQKKLMAAFKVPKAFLGYEEDISGKATLAAQDVRFARTVERIQRIMTSELHKIAIIHLYTQGYRGAELLDFELSMSSPSTIYEQEKIALWKEKIALSDSITNSKMLSREWVYNNILSISDEEMKEEIEKITKETKMLAELEKMQQDLLSPPQEAGVPGAEGEGAPSGEVPQATENPAKGEDATKKIVDALAQLGGAAPDDEDEDEDEDGEEIEEGGNKGSKLIKKKIGRPTAGYRRNVDSHPLGRDPFGSRENKRALRPESASLTADIAGVLKSLELLPTTEYQTLLSEDKNDSTK
jgi:hypothetical protein